MEVIKKFNNPTKTFFGLKSINKISKVVGLNKKILVITSKEEESYFENKLQILLTHKIKFIF